MLKDKKEIINEALNLAGELYEWKLEDMLRFFVEKRDGWGGLSPVQLIDADKGECVIKFFTQITRWRSYFISKERSGDKVYS